MVHIRNAENGYIVTETDDFDHDAAVSIPVVVAEDHHVTNDVEQRVEAGLRLLWEIIERLGLSGSKHDSHRLRVVVVDQGNPAGTDRVSE